METKTSKPKALKKPSVSRAVKATREQKLSKPKEMSGALADKTEEVAVKVKPYFLKIIIIFAVVLLIAGGAFYVLNRFGYINPTLTDQKILTQLKKIILLPDNLTPSMAIVTNAETLKSQQPAFFADVKNGDRLIIYPDLVILYDYNANKIIKIGPVQSAKAQ